MEKLVSSWVGVQTLPENYILPPDKRPGNIIVLPSNQIPVIDLSKAEELGQDRSMIVEQVLEASQDFGCFQVINHGVSENLMDDAMNLFKEFFNMPAEDKATVFPADPSGSCKLYTSSFNYAKEDTHFWRDSLRHPCYPSEEFMQFWPEKPTRYREVVGKYSAEVRDLLLRVLQLICRGLGLEREYFGHDQFTKDQLLAVNHYPQCPDPSVTLGLPKHCDPNLITIIQQGDVYGLQVFNDGQWLGVKPLPNAFVVNIAYQLQVISNGKLRSVEHRVVTNSNNSRTTILTAFYPCYETVIEPAKELISGCSPQLYRAFQYKDFLANYSAKGGDTETMLDPYKLPGLKNGMQNEYPTLNDVKIGVLD